MFSKLIILSIFLTLFVSYSLTANVKRAADYGSGNNAGVVDNAGEAPIVKENAGKEDMSLREMATNAIAGAVQSGIANKLLGNGNGNGNGNDSYNQGGGEQPAAPEDTGVDAPPPYHESKLRKVINGAIQGAIAGGAAAAVGTAYQNRNNN
uniref:Uncharacterized protein n=1 Tax=Panagrolaimus sp. PS1159 TaxID=55785 RepID=A0AC35FGH8_9BILA